jgi:hypothetical protein
MRAVLLAAAIAVLAGCAASGVQVTEQAATQFREGVSTEAEILKTLGPPTTVTVAGGHRFLGYTGMQYRIKPASFVPIVGMFAGGTDYAYSSALYEIRSDGVLEHVTYTSAGGAGQAGTTPAPMPSTAPRAIP